MNKKAPQLQTTSTRITGQGRRIVFKYCLLFAACCMVTFTSCDDSFQPLQKNNLFNFTISGYLNASADTQWVRVEPLGQDINDPTDTTGIQVTLEHLQSDQIVVMNDSLFTSRNILNFWTTMDIENEQTYRIVAEHADGETSRVTVTTPKELPLPFIVNSGPPAGANIYIDDAVEHITDVQSVWYVILNPGTENQRRMYRFPIRHTLKQTTAFFGGYFAFANWEKELAQIEQSIGGAEMTVAARQFFVAAGGPEWDDTLSSIDDFTYFLDGTGSNVENGLGYVVGIDGKWFRQIGCLASDRSRHVPCNPDDGPFWYHE